MRIIKGKYKSRRIQAPKNIPTRPTTDFAKEGLFNIIENRLDIEDLVVLDLFSGTGNISFEFASRGAQQVTSIEQNSNCVRFQSKFAAELDTTIVVKKYDVFKWLRKKEHEQYNMIFADPPYQLKQLKEIPDLILQQNWLQNDGVLILEHGKEYDFSTHKHFDFLKTYGHVNFSFFSAIAANE